MISASEMRESLALNIQFSRTQIFISICRVSIRLDLPRIGLIYAACPDCGLLSVLNFTVTSSPMDKILYRHSYLV